MKITGQVNLRSSQGFTLIELVIVIVIIGILAVAAIPQYINLAQSAQVAATQSVASALTSASVINFGARTAGTGGVAVASCDTIGTLLQGGALPTGYTIPTGQAITAGATVQCNLNGPKGTTATFVGYGIA